MSLLSVNVESNYLWTDRVIVGVSCSGLQENFKICTYPTDDASYSRRTLYSLMIAVDYACSFGRLPEVDETALNGEMFPLPRGLRSLPGLVYWLPCLNQLIQFVSAP